LYISAKLLGSHVEPEALAKLADVAPAEISYADDPVLEPIL
jgi:hypothetical protein